MKKYASFWDVYAPYVKLIPPECVFTRLICQSKKKIT